MAFTSIGRAGPELKVAAKAKPPTSTKPSTNAVVIPQSVFVMPPTSQDGRDPFFPTSIRPYANAQMDTNKPISTVALTMNGVGGTAENRFVMINGTTFAQDETHEILTSSGRVKVHCLEIKSDSAVVEVNGVPRELRMKEEKVTKDAEGLKVSGKN